MLKDPRLENGTESLTAEKVYKILNIFLIAIGFELETFNIDHLNLSVQDERDLLGILDKISQLLEGYEKGKLNFNFLFEKCIIFFNFKSKKHQTNSKSQKILGYFFKNVVEKVSTNVEN